MVILRDLVEKHTYTYMQITLQLNQQYHKYSIQGGCWGGGWSFCSKQRWHEHISRVLARSVRCPHCTPALITGRYESASGQTADGRASDCEARMKQQMSIN